MQIWYNCRGNENRPFCPALRMKRVVSVFGFDISLHPGMNAKGRALSHAVKSIP
jgi:hypothetical protein